ncbi:hypothetical protein [Pelagicoccus sp. SDUM812003]|uniref:hypothetical protein n=1 Tax=Pelagicoccus sp. SDUM812003 TaxID=3041267 RepID=UPI00280F614A|nr:hypothetical protein [Pelagicoccus sp. SDUM812003]MDQ8204073.1 hypothetical protein [Pelagicoccus sp. SDUM812003]
MLKTTVSILAIAGALAATSTLHAQDGQWSFSVQGGPVYSTGGDVHRGPSFDGSVLLGLDPGSLPVDVDAKSFDDVYGDFMELSVEAIYRKDSSLSYFFGLRQMQSDEGILRVGTVADSLPLNGRFSDYDDLGLYGGVRYHFVTESKWQPHVSVQLGIKEVDEITASFSVPDVTFVDPYQGALTNAAFYDDSTVWSGGIGFGLDYRASETVVLGVETGFYMQEALDDNDSVLDVLGLGALNDEGDMEFMPLRFVANFEF